MTTTEQKTNETTRSDAYTATKRKHHRGLAAGAIGIVGLGAGLTALIIGVTGGTDTEAPSPGVPPSVEVPFDPSDPKEMKGIDNWLYQLAEQHRQAQR